MYEIFLVDRSPAVQSRERCGILFWFNTRIQQAPPKTRKHNARAAWQVAGWQVLQLHSTTTKLWSYGNRARNGWRLSPGFFSEVMLIIWLYHDVFILRIYMILLLHDVSHTWCMTRVRHHVQPPPPQKRTLLYEKIHSVQQPAAVTYHIYTIRRLHGLLVDTLTPSETNFLLLIRT